MKHTCCRQYFDKGMEVECCGGCCQCTGKKCFFSGLWYKLLKSLFKPTIIEDMENPTSSEKIVPSSIFTPKTPIGIEQYKNENIDILICGLAWAESRSTRDKINYNTIGDLNIKDHAYGYLQIRIGVLSQVNQLWGTKYKVEDLLGEEGAKLSYKVCKDYLLKVVPQYKSFKLALKEGVPLFEIYAKSWNGGAGWYVNSLKNGYENYAKGLNDYYKTVLRGMK